MSIESGFTPSYVQPEGSSAVRQELKAASSKAREMDAKASDLKEDVMADQQDAFNPFAANRRIKEKAQQLKSRAPPPKDGAKKAKAAKPVSKEAALKQGQDAAKQFVKQNPELNQGKLENLLKQLMEGDHSPEEILKLAQDVHDDPTLTDQVLEFLKENGPDKLEKKIKKAQEDFRARKRREIAAGKNVQSQASEFSAKGLGSPSFLRDLYRKITGDPMEEHDMFDDLSSTFSYEQLIEAIRFLLHALGDDIKAKGPSIPKGELFSLITEVRKLQLILGVYRFFEDRMNLLYDFFDRYELDYPDILTFQLLARMFVLQTKDHYPNMQKFLQLGKAFQLEEDPLALMIVLSQMRDAIRNVSPRLFYSLKHRQDVLQSSIDAIQNLENIIEEEEEEEDEEEED